MLLLERFAYTPQGTFGRLNGIGEMVYTIERPWLDNAPGESCIPTGDYELEPHSSNTYPQTWALIGETVSHYSEPGKTRSAILFHPGNTIDDMRGCICPGMELGVVYDKWAVIQSRDAMERLRRMVERDGELRMIIVNHMSGKL